MLSRDPGAMVLLAACVAHLAASGCSGRREPPPPRAKPEVATLIVGENVQHGNIITVQPYMEPEDYQSTWHFHVKIASYLKVAHDKGWIWKKTLVVFPDAIGAGLVAIDEDPDVYRRGSEDELFSALAGAYRGGVLARLPFASVDDRTRYAIYDLKAKAMARTYQRVFAHLAREYSVFIVAGTIVLPGPRVVDGEIRVTEGGPLYNAAFLFGPDGRVIDAPVLEAHPTAIERAYLSEGSCFKAPVFELPSVRLGVLVGEDAFYPQCYGALKEQRAEVVVALMWQPRRGSWQVAWTGYDGYNAPSEFAGDEIGAISTHDAYLKYALPGLLLFSGAKIGVTTFMRGRLWGLEPDGQILLMQEGELTEGPYTVGAALLNLWLSGALPDAELVAPATTEPQKRR